jgi:hypothetical protein
MKIEMLGIAVKNTHCKRVLFGGLHDAGYRRMFTSHTDEEKKKVILLESVPFAAPLRHLTSDYIVESFEDVFSSTILSHVNTPPRSPPPGTWAAAVSTQPRNTAPSTQTPGTNSAQPQPKISTGSQSQSITGIAPVRELTNGRVWRNANGQRIDIAIQNADYSIYQKSPSNPGSKFCNAHYLLGNCPYPHSCRYQHEVTMGIAQLGALLGKSRKSPCRGGSACSDGDCILGHACLNVNCNGSSCPYKFPKEMHGVNQTHVSG